MNETTRKIAEILHERDCLEEAERSCRRWASGHESGVRHRDFYNRQAETIYGKLEPEIGGANVLLAVETIVRTVK